jgi:hypothetical protein
MEIKLFEFDDSRNIYKGWLKKDYEMQNYKAVAEFDLEGNCINNITGIKITIKDITSFWNTVTNQD